ncbi:MAG: AbrB/MazE/SpoVT family DNA-binding domain-containing protein [Chloroflexi bacterium]|nr:AbrB/MazE/SpoVT family DNA-binding domain-containing protein [Chloroflexota bacterium]
MQAVKVSNKFQIAIPAAVRRRLGIKRGDRLLVDVRGDHVLLMREPENYSAKLAGLHAEVWSGVDAREYVRREREAWAD